MEDFSEIRDLINQIKEVKKKRIVWASKTIKAETRKLRSEWTRDMAYDIDWDLSQYSGIDSSIEEELINTLLKELGK